MTDPTQTRTAAYRAIESALASALQIFRNAEQIIAALEDANAKNFAVYQKTQRECDALRTENGKLRTQLAPFLPLREYLERNPLHLDGDGPVEYRITPHPFEGAASGSAAWVEQYAAAVDGDPYYHAEDEFTDTGYTRRELDAALAAQKVSDAAHV